MYNAIILRLKKLTDRHEIRSISLAYITSLLSKIATLGVQLWALPAISYSIGVEKLGAMLAIAALAAFAAIPALSAAPVASQAVASELGQGSRQDAVQQFWFFAIIGLVGAGLVMTLGMAIALLVDPVFLFGESAADYSVEIRYGIIAATLHLMAYYLFGFMEGVRAAYAENHITNIFGFVASCLVVLLCLWLSASGNGSIFSFYLALFALPLVVQLPNLIVFLYQRPYHFQGKLSSKIKFRQNCVKLISYIRFQVGISMHLHIGVLLTTRFVGLETGALHGAVTRLFILFHSVVLALSNPVLPWISKYRSAGKLQATWKITGTTSVFLLSLQLSFAVFFAFFGATLMSWWLNIGADTPVTTYYLFGLFFVGYSCNGIIYVILMHLDLRRNTATMVFLSGSVFGLILFVPAGDIDLNLILSISCIGLILIAGIYSAINLGSYLVKPPVTGKQ